MSEAIALTRQIILPQDSSILEMDKSKSLSMHIGTDLKFGNRPDQ